MKSESLWAKAKSKGKTVMNLRPVETGARM